MKKVYLLIFGLLVNLPSVSWVHAQEASVKAGGAISLLNVSYDPTRSFTRITTRSLRSIGRKRPDRI